MPFWKKLISPLFTKQKRFCNTKLKENIDPFHLFLQFLLYPSYLHNHNELKYLAKFYSYFKNLCCWHVIRKVIWYATKLRNYEFSKYYVIFILVFFSMYKSETANRAETAAWINRYYIIFRKFVILSHVK